MAALKPRHRDLDANPSGRGLLNGPSDGIRKWTAYIFDDVLDRLIDAQLRLRRPTSPGQQPRKAWRATLGLGGFVVLLSVAERLTGL